MSNIGELVRLELEDILPRGGITTHRADLEAIGTDVCAITRFRISFGEDPILADYLVFPETAEQVALVVRLANQYHIPVTPRGAGAGDTLGSVALYGGIVIDMSKMDKVLEIDGHNCTVTSQTGILQCDLEDELNRRGYTLNFFPASLYCSSLGGFLANRGSGTLSTKYGKLESLVLSMEIVLPTGDVVTTLPVPHHSTGPELNQLFLGSEGTLGIITRVKLKMFPLPKERRFNAFLFGQLPAAIEAGRRIMVNRLGPSVIRVYDETDTEAILKDVLGFKGSGSIMIIGFDGNPEIVEVQERLSFELIKECNGEDLGRTLGTNWWENRFKSYYPPYNLESAPVLHGVIDTCAPFDRILKIYDEQKEAIEKNFKGFDVVYQAHFSHWYDYGTTLYPTFTVRRLPADLSGLLLLNSEIWNTGVRIAIKNGGTVNEHHGIGLKLGRFMKENYGPSFMVLKKIKKALDPNGIVNPGKLGFEGWK